MSAGAEVFQGPEPGRPNFPSLGRHTRAHLLSAPRRRSEHPATIGEVIARGTAQPQPRRIVALYDAGPIRRGMVLTWREDAAGGAWWSADGLWCLPLLMASEFIGEGRLYGPAPAEQLDLVGA